MRKDTIREGQKATKSYMDLESIVRQKAQDFIQEILEEEITELLGRNKSERIKDKIDQSKGYRNGYGKPRRLALMNGTIDYAQRKGYLKIEVPAEKGSDFQKLLQQQSKFNLDTNSRKLIGVDKLRIWIKKI